MNGKEERQLSPQQQMMKDMDDAAERKRLEPLPPVDAAALGEERTGSPEEPAPGEEPTGGPEEILEESPPEEEVGEEPGPKESPADRLAKLEAELAEKNKALAQAQDTIGDQSRLLLEVEPGEEPPDETGVERRPDDGGLYPNILKMIESLPQTGKIPVDPAAVDTILQGGEEGAAALGSLLTEVSLFSAELGAQEAMRREPERTKRREQQRGRQQAIRDAFYSRHGDLDKDGFRDHVMVVTKKVFSHPQYAGRRFTEDIGDVIAQTARANLGLPEPVRDGEGKIVTAAKEPGKGKAALGARTRSGERRRDPAPDKYAGLSAQQRAMKETEDYAERRGLVKPGRHK